MLKLLARLAREANWARRRWSAATDQAFHDALYRTADYDPFSPSYPGYATIRRFADLVEPHLPTGGLVVDFGCGPGEITCELAARRGDLTFVGVDHSAAAIDRARTNASRRNLTNTRFDCASAEEYDPTGDVALAALFDSFHHLIDPARFVRRLQPKVGRWALIEPRGSWAGTWQKDLDFDWLARDLASIRSHIEASLSQGDAARVDTVDDLAVQGEAASSPAEAGLYRCQSHDGCHSHEHAGVAVERRYALDDLERFFDGLELDLRGTVAGLETYPPTGSSGPGLRERFGEIHYELLREIDARLFDRNLDLHAKHWLIVAERGGRSRQVTLRSGLDPDVHRRVAGSFDVRYGDYHGPRRARPNESILATVTITNEGWDEWSSDKPSEVFVSYHWLHADGRIALFDGERTRLPRTVGPGSVVEVAITARAPSAAGRYRLAIDLVREGVTWFSQAGHPCLEIPFQVLD